MRTISLAVAMVAGGLTLIDGPSTLFAQNAKAKAGTAKKTTAENATAEANQELPNLNFDSMTRDNDEYVPDPDETPDGRAQLTEVENRARAIYGERNGVEKERRPIAVQRDTLVNEMRQLNDVIVGSRNTITQANNRIAAINRQLNIMNNQALVNERNGLQTTVANLNTVIQTNNAEIVKRQPQVNALNIALKPLDDRLRKLWEELNACRKQWLDLRTPQDKYARADFEGLKRVIDDWLRIDGLWPQACCWGALVAYELEDYEGAAELVEKAEKLRVEVIGSKKTWPQIEVLQGLVALKTPGQRSKSAGLINKAMSHVDKEKDWETHFVAGRAVSENERQATKAKAYLERALKIKPTSLCAKYWMARLQTTSSDKSVQDIAAGTKLLESLWSRTGKRSWRISFSLVQAYDAANRTSDADRQWATTLALAPPSQHADLSSQRTN